MPESHLFVDDYTGTSLNRPQFTKLRDLVRERLAQAVIVHDLDRLSRKLAHQLLLSDEFEQAGVTSSRDHAADDKTPETQLLSNVRVLLRNTNAPTFWNVPCADCADVPKKGP